MNIDLDKEEINYLLIAVKEMDKRIAEMKEKHNWDFEKEIKSYANIREKLNVGLVSPLAKF